MEKSLALTLEFYLTLRNFPVKTSKNTGRCKTDLVREAMEEYLKGPGKKVC